MQTFVDQFTALLQSWNAVTLSITLLDLITTALISALCLWFLCALFYHAKIAKLRRLSHRKLADVEQERSKVSATLDETAKQLLNTEQALDNKHQQWQAADQAVQEHVSRSLTMDSQMQEALRLLQQGVFAKEPLPQGSIVDTAPAWQNYQGAVNELSNRVQAMQVEKTRLNAVLTDNALTIQSLQQQLNSQIEQITKLDRTISAQQVAFEQTQQALLDLQAEHASLKSMSGSSALAGYGEDLREMAQATNTMFDKVAHQAETVIEDVVEDVVSGFNSVFHPDQQTAAAEKDNAGSLSVKPVDTDLTVATVSPAQGALSEKTSAASKLKGMFGLGKSSQPLVSTADSPVLQNETTPKAEEKPSKLKSMFGLSAKKPAIEPVPAAETKELSIESGATSHLGSHAVSIEPDKATAKIAQATVLTEKPELSQNAELSEKTAPESKLKGMFGRFGSKKQVVGPEAAAAQNNTPQVTASSSAALSSVVSATKIVQSEGADVVTLSSPAIETKENPTSTSKLKGMFGKFGSKKPETDQSPASEQTNTSQLSNSGHDANNLVSRQHSQPTEAGNVETKLAQASAVSAGLKPETKSSSGKLTSLFGRFNKAAIADYVETALEKSDEQVAEQALEEVAMESQDLPKKTKGFWAKLPFGK